jgi:hypothetical protein
MTMLGVPGVRHDHLIDEQTSNLIDDHANPV